MALAFQSIVDTFKMLVADTKKTVQQVSAACKNFERAINTEKKKEERQTKKREEEIEKKPNCNIPCFAYFSG